MKPFDLFRKLNIDQQAKALQVSSTKLLIELKKQVYKSKISKYLTDQKGYGENILISAYDGGIGNAVEATPLVLAARSLWPAANLYFLTQYPTLFKNWCVPDKILSSLEQLENISFDKTFISHYGWKSPKPWINEYTLGNVHYPKVWMNSYFLKPEREYNTGMLKKYGFRGNCQPTYVSLEKPDFHLPEANFRICILPCAKNEVRWDKKRWPYYAELISELLELKKDCQICILGTTEDKINGNLSESDRIFDFRGKFSLPQTAWLLKNSDLAIGNDCGPVHISAAVGTRTIAIFGPTCVIKNHLGGKTKIITSSIMPDQYIHNWEHKNKEYYYIEEIRKIIDLV